MKPIQKDELYAHLSDFLKAKGVEMKDGAYPRGIQTACGFMADAINLSQQGIVQAKAQFDKNLDRMRQVIHESTAPSSTPKPGAAPKTKAQNPKSQAAGPKRKSAKR